MSTNDGELDYNIYQVALLVLTEVDMAWGKTHWDKKCPSQNKLNVTTGLTSGRPRLSLTSPEPGQHDYSFLHSESDRALRSAILLQE